MSEHCISCGMSMETTEDHAVGDVTREHCKFCSNPDGSLKSYEEVLAGLTQAIMKSHEMSETDARSAAKGIMHSLPAWHKVPGC